MIDHKMLGNWTFGPGITVNRSPTFGPGDVVKMKTQAGQAAKQSI